MRNAGNEIVGLNVRRPDTAQPTPLRRLCNCGFRRSRLALEAAIAFAALHRTRIISVGLRRSTGFLVLLAVTITPAYADSLFPAAGQLWPNDYLHFFSTDMRPVQVTLRGNMSTNDDEQVTMSLPRAWIIFASGYDPLKIDHLPDTIRTRAVILALTDPDGAALSIRSREIADQQRIDLDAAVKQLRAEQDYVEITYVRGHIRTEDIQINSAHDGRGNIERDGLAYDPVWRRYLGKIGLDAFYFAECQSSPKLDTFCRYATRPGRNIALLVDFLDFRFHGGPSYANGRLSRMTTVLCRQIELYCFSSDGLLPSTPR